MATRKKSNNIKRKLIVEQSKYKPEYCEMLIKHMAQGLSFATFGAVVGCGRTTLYHWCDLYEDFSNAKKEGTERAQRFFEQRLMAKVSGQEIEGIDTKKIDTACLIFALKTRFHKTWGEKQKIEHSGDGLSIHVTYEGKDVE